MQYDTPASFAGQQHRYYREGYALPPMVGNNGFSADRKSERPSLDVTPWQLGSLEDLRVGQHVAFQDFDGDEWMPCQGLEIGLLILDHAIPMYIFDNHNHAFYAWAEAMQEGWFSEGAVLVHMDAHYDDTVPSNTDVDLKDLADVFRYTNEVLQIATFVKPALELGMCSRVINYVESPEFEHLEDLQGQEVVINLDLDVFCDEMSHVSYQQKLAVLQHYMPQTKLITMSTSPFFIPQKKAIAMAKRCVGDLL